MVKTVLILITLIALVIPFSLGVGAKQPAPQQPYINSALLPGHKINPSVCNWEHSDGHDLYCEAVIGDEVINFAYDDHTQTIISSTWPVRGKVIADFIVIWGTPSGIALKQDGLTRIYWDERCVWLLGGRFTPSSKVYFLEYELVPDETERWHGFDQRVNE